MGKNIQREEFSQTLQKFIQRLIWLNQADRPQTVVEQVLLWTGGQPLLTKKLFKLIIESKLSISAGKEAVIVEKLVRSSLLAEVQDQTINAPIRERIYQKDLELILREDKGNISTANRIYLNILQRRLSLPQELIRKIEAKSLAPYRQIQATKKVNLQQYEQVFYQLTQRQYPLTNKDRQSLERLQQLLQLTQEDIKTVEAKIIPLLSPTQPSEKQSKLSWQWSLLFLIPLAIALGLTTQTKGSRVNDELDSSYQLCSRLSVNDEQRSLGENVLTGQYLQNHNQKSLLALQQGKKAFANCDFSEATDKFKDSLAALKNNPEALIYLNNAQTAEQPSVKIAVSVPTGTHLALALEMLRGVAQAQTEINQEGGIGDKLLQVEIVNDNNEPESAKQIASELVKDESILAVIGPNRSDASLAAAKVYQRGGLVMITPTSSAMGIPEIGSYIFRSTPNVSLLASTLSKYVIKSANKTKIAICSDSNSAASQSFANEFNLAVQSHGGTIVSTVCELSNPKLSLNEVVSQALEDGAETLFLAPGVKTISSAVEVAKANRQRLLLLGNHTMYTAETIKQGQASVENLVISVPWHPNAFSDHVFSQNAQQLWGGSVNWRTAMTYDATNALIQGLKQSATREELRAALSDPRFSVNGASGQFTFDDGDRVGKVQLIEVKKADHSYGYQFVPIEIEDN